MWTEEQRRIYRREGDGYPSDWRDAGWARLEPLIPKASPGGRSRKTDMRAAMNAILHLPAARGAVGRATAFCRAPRSKHLSGVPARRGLGATWAELHMALHERMGREASSSAAVLDS